MGYMESYKAWCANEYFDEATRAELKSIEGNEKEIEDRFYKDLEFGTGGFKRCYRQRYKPHEYLYCQKGNTGTCKLY